MEKILRRIIAIAFILSSGMAVTSCIEEGEDAVNGKGQNYIRIVASVDADSEINKASAAFEAFPSTGTFLEIRRDAITNAALNEAVSISFAIDNTIVDQYNAYVDQYNAEADEFNSDLDEDNDGYDEIDPMPYKDNFLTVEAERYSISETTVNFAPGEFAKFIPLTLDPSGEGTSLGQMDFTAIYGLGVKVTAAPSNYTVMQEGTNVLVQVVVKNKYDGKYATNIWHKGWAAFGIAEFIDGEEGEDYPSGVALVTAGPKSVGIANLNRGDDLLPGFSGTPAEPAATGFGASSPVFTFDDNDKMISVTNAYPDDGRGRAFEMNPNAPAEHNVYDPATKTMTLDFIFKQNGRPNMYYIWVMEYSGPR
jgi:hypothetical protein